MNYLGFFGKLPGKGDFLHNGLDSTEREIWDDWLQQGMNSAKQALAGDWSGAYVCRRAWRFLSRRGEQRHSGILMLSRDRVGREFPFLVLYAAAAGPANPQGRGIADLDAALSPVQGLVEAAYDGSVQPDQLAALLQILSWQADIGNSSRDAGAGLVTYAKRKPGPVSILETAVLDAMLGDGSEAPGRSLWWRHTADGAVDRVIVNAGTNSERLFLQLLSADSEDFSEGMPSESGSVAVEPADSVGVAGSPATPEVKTKPTGEDPVDFDSLLG